MPESRRPPRDDAELSGTGMATAGLSVAVLAILCCAGPVLLAAGALAALGGILGNPWVIAAAAVVVVGAVTAVVRRRRAGRDLARPSTESNATPEGRDHPPAPADKEGPYRR